MTLVHDSSHTSIIFFLANDPLAFLDIKTRLHCEHTTAVVDIPNYVLESDDTIIYSHRFLLLLLYKIIPEYFQRLVYNLIILAEKP